MISNIVPITTAAATPRLNLFSSLSTRGLSEQDITKEAKNSIAISLIFVKKFMLMTKEILLHGIILGFFLFASYAFQTIGCQYTTAGKNAFLTAIYVVLIPFFLWALTKTSAPLDILLYVIDKF